MSKITITNTAHTGYRRAGIQFTAGANTLDTTDISKQQLAQIHADPRLVSQDTQASTDQKSEEKGVVDAERISELVTFIGQLDREDKKLWKAGNTPKASAFPRGTTEEERTAAWDAFIESLEKSDSPSDSKENVDADSDQGE